MEEINIYKIIWSPTFIKELNDICSYIYINLKEPKIAKKFYRTVVEKLNSLKFFPERHISLKVKDIEFRKLLLKKLYNYLSS